MFPLFCLSKCHCQKKSEQSLPFSVTVIMRLELDSTQVCGTIRLKGKTHHLNSDNLVSIHAFQFIASEAKRAKLSYRRLHLVCHDRPTDRPVFSQRGTFALWTFISSDFQNSFTFYNQFCCCHSSF